MKVLYHASPIPGIEVLQPRVSNHGTPQMYFSEKRENVLVYLSNAVEKFCKENGFRHQGIWKKWASYGFTPSGQLHIEEYYPNALKDTYCGVKAYIYAVIQEEAMKPMADIPGAYICVKEVPVYSSEVIENAYSEIIHAEKEGLLLITRYGELPERRLAWIRKTMAEEYRNSVNYPEYRYFIEKKFGFIL